MAIEKNFYQDFTERRENKYKPTTIKNTIDNLNGIMYNENKKSTPSITPITDFASKWKEDNKDLFKYAGDSAKESIENGLKEAPNYMSDADEGTYFSDVQTASVKRNLAKDANDDKLHKSALMEMIGHLSKDNKEPYLKHTLPLQTYIDAKDKFDFNQNNYTTTKNIDTTPDENVRQLQRELNEAGYTDKFGQSLKEDGVYGGKTAYADDSKKAHSVTSNNNYNSTEDIPNATDIEYVNNTNQNKRKFSIEDLPYDDLLKLLEYLELDVDDLDVVNIDITEDGMVRVPQKTASLSGPMGSIYVPIDNILNKVGEATNTVKSAAKKVINKIDKAIETLTSKVTWESLFSAREQGVAMLDLKNGYSLSKKADERAIKYAEKNNIDKDENGKIITWGNKTDAYRHFTWNYEMASELGYSTALKISSAHEIAYLRANNLVSYSDTGDINDRKAFMTPLMLMDVWNNLKGVNSFSEFRDKDYNFEKAFDIMTERNALVYNGEQALKAFGFTENDILIQDVNGEKLLGVKVYFSYKNGYITNIRKAD